MIRDDEDRILHGLYFCRERIDHEIEVSGEQILWLAMHPLAEGEHWERDGQFQNVDSNELPEPIRAKLIAAKLDLPLQYLAYRRLIKIARHRDATLTVSVTFAGADRAIRLHSWQGRFDLWYRDHKDGILGLIVNVLVSSVTALLAVLLLGGHH